jgi:shikimate kinase
MKKYKNIYLIGLMGSGKTTLGKILSKKLDKQFYDSDQVIEEKLGVNVPMIFEYEGEAGFRER